MTSLHQEQPIELSSSPPDNDSDIDPVSFVHFRFSFVLQIALIISIIVYFSSSILLANTVW